MIVEWLLVVLTCLIADSNQQFWTNHKNRRNQEVVWQRYPTVKDLDKFRNRNNEVYKQLGGHENHDFRRSGDHSEVSAYVNELSKRDGNPSIKITYKKRRRKKNHRRNGQQVQNTVGSNQEYNLINASKDTSITGDREFYLSLLAKTLSQNPRPRNVFLTFWNLAARLLHVNTEGLCNSQKLNVVLEVLQHMNNTKSDSGYSSGEDQDQIYKLLRENVIQLLKLLQAKSPDENKIYQYLKPIVNENVKLHPILLSVMRNTLQDKIEQVDESEYPSWNKVMHGFKKIDHSFAFEIAQKTDGLTWNSLRDKLQNYGDQNDGFDAVTDYAYQETQDGIDVSDYENQRKYILILIHLLEAEKLDSEKIIEILQTIKNSNIELHPTLLTLLNKTVSNEFKDIDVSDVIGEKVVQGLKELDISLPSSDAPAVYSEPQEDINNLDGVNVNNSKLVGRDTGELNSMPSSHFVEVFPFDSALLNEERVNYPEQAKKVVVMLQLLIAERPDVKEINKILKTMLDNNYKVHPKLLLLLKEVLNKKHKELDADSKDLDWGEALHNFKKFENKSTLELNGNDQMDYNPIINDSDNNQEIVNIKDSTFEDTSQKGNLFEEQNTDNNVQSLPKEESEKARKPNLLSDEPLTSEEYQTYHDLSNNQSEIATNLSQEVLETKETEVNRNRDNKVLPDVNSTWELAPDDGFDNEYILDEPKYYLDIENLLTETENPSKFEPSLPGQIHIYPFYEPNDNMTETTTNDVLKTEEPKHDDSDGQPTDNHNNNVPEKGIDNLSEPELIGNDENQTHYIPAQVEFGQDVDNSGENETEPNHFPIHLEELESATSSSDILPSNNNNQYTSEELKYYSDIDNLQLTEKTPQFDELPRHLPMHHNQESNLMPETSTPNEQWTGQSDPDDLENNYNISEKQIDHSPNTTITSKEINNNNFEVPVSDKHKTEESDQNTFTVEVPDLNQNHYEEQAPIYDEDKYQYDPENNQFESFNRLESQESKPETSFVVEIPTFEKDFSEISYENPKLESENNYLQFPESKPKITPVVKPLEPFNVFSHDHEVPISDEDDSNYNSDITNTFVPKPYQNVYIQRETDAKDEHIIVLVTPEKNFEATGKEYENPNYQPTPTEFDTDIYTPIHVPKENTNIAQLEKEPNIVLIPELQSKETNISIPDVYPSNDISTVIKQNDASWFIPTNEEFNVASNENSVVNIPLITNQSEESTERQVDSNDYQITNTTDLHQVNESGTENQGDTNDNELENASDLHNVNLVNIETQEDTNDYPGGKEVGESNEDKNYLQLKNTTVPNKINLVNTESQHDTNDNLLENVPDLYEVNLVDTESQDDTNNSRLETGTDLHKVNIANTENQDDNYNQRLVLLLLQQLTIKKPNVESIIEILESILKNNVRPHPKLLPLLKRELVKRYKDLEDTASDSDFNKLLHDFNELNISVSDNTKLNDIVKEKPLSENVPSELDTPTSNKFEANVPNNIVLDSDVEKPGTQPNTRDEVFTIEQFEPKPESSNEDYQEITDSKSENTNLEELDPLPNKDNNNNYKLISPQQDLNENETKEHMPNEISQNEYHPQTEKFKPFDQHESLNVNIERETPIISSSESDFDSSTQIVSNDESLLDDHLNLTDSSPNTTFTSEEINNNNFEEPVSDEHKTEESDQNTFIVEVPNLNQNHYEEQSPIYNEEKYQYDPENNQFGYSNHLEPQESKPETSFVVEIPTFEKDLSEIPYEKQKLESENNYLQFPESKPKITPVVKPLEPFNVSNHDYEIPVSYEEDSNYNSEITNTFEPKPYQNVYIQPETDEKYQYDPENNQFDSFNHLEPQKSKPKTSFVVEIPTFEKDFSEIPESRPKITPVVEPLEPFNVYNHDYEVPISDEEGSDYDSGITNTFEPKPYHVYTQPETDAIDEHKTIVVTPEKIDLIYTPNHANNEYNSYIRHRQPIPKYPYYYSSQENPVDLKQKAQIEQEIAPVVGSFESMEPESDSTLWNHRDKNKLPDFAVFVHNLLHTDSSEMDSGTFSLQEEPKISGKVFYYLENLYQLLENNPDEKKIKNIVTLLNNNNVNVNVKYLSKLYSNPESCKQNISNTTCFKCLQIMLQKLSFPKYMIVHDLKFITWGYPRDNLHDLKDGTESSNFFDQGLESYKHDMSTDPKNLLQLLLFKLLSRHTPDHFEVIENDLNNKYE